MQQLDRKSRLQPFLIYSSVLSSSCFSLSCNCLQAEVIDPAVNGTLNVLRSCKRSATVRRVVITSSSSTIRIRNDIQPEQMLDEDSWTSLDVCYEFKVETCPGIRFFLSVTRMFSSLCSSSKILSLRCSDGVFFTASDIHSDTKKIHLHDQCEF